MDKVLAVARREFLATVRTKAFILSLVLMPAIIVCSIYGVQSAQGLSRAESLPIRRLAVVDQTGEFSPAFAAQVEIFNTQRPNQPVELESVPPAKGDRAVLAARLRDGSLYGYLIVAPDVISNAGECVLARKDTQLETGRRFDDMIQNAVLTVRLRQAGIDPAVEAQLRERHVPVVQLDAKTGQPVTSDEAVYVLTPFAFMFLLFMGTFAISQGLLTSLIEEKSSRVMEVLLSAVSPVRLMVGKILGMVVVGFLLLAVWGGAALGSASVYHVRDVVTGYRLLITLLYFVPGFLLISSMLAAIGSACNELKEAQSMVFPLSIMTVIPMIFWMYITQNPASPLSLLLSYFPPITPFVMVLRACADPDTPLWQIVSTLAVLWGAVIVAMWAAGKIFRVGVLMYGKPPSLRELLRWVRYA